MRQFIGIIRAMGMLGIIPGMFAIIGPVIGMDIAALIVALRGAVAGRLYNRIGGHHSQRFYNRQLYDFPVISS
jgi:hypothetical protein